MGRADHSLEFQQLEKLGENSIAGLSISRVDERNELATHSPDAPLNERLGAWHRDGLHTGRSATALLRVRRPTCAQPLRRATFGVPCTQHDWLGLLQADATHS